MDGVTETDVLAVRVGVEPAALTPLQKEIERAVSFVNGFYRFASENMTLEKYLFVCTQLGLGEDTAKTAIDNFSIPWREENGWRSYVRQDAAGI